MKSVVSSTEEKIKNISDRIQKLKDDIRNVDVAVEKINRGLEFIFFNKNRLSIELETVSSFV